MYDHSKIRIISRAHRIIQFLLTLLLTRKLQMELEDRTNGTNVSLWSDSKCALHWIQNHSRLLPKYLQNPLISS